MDDLVRGGQGRSSEEVLDSAACIVIPLAVATLIGVLCFVLWLVG